MLLSFQQNPVLVGEPGTIQFAFALGIPNLTGTPLYQVRALKALSQHRGPYRFGPLPASIFKQDAECSKSCPSFAKAIVCLAR